MAGGNALSNSKVNIIKSIDLEAFKYSLNKSFPLIDTIYNSGNISTSFLSDFKNLIYNIFEFDINNPLTMLNTQSPLLADYYAKDFQQSRENKENVAENNSDNTDTGLDEKITQNDKPPELKQAESSITYDEADEDRDFSKNNVVQDGKIILQNETKFNINIAQLLKEPLKFKFDRKGPKVLIYHTHTSESYLQGWTNDGRYGVIKVGEEIAKNLRKKYNMDVIHNATINDYDFNSSYVNALGTANKIIKGNPSVRIVLDVHRDGLAKGEKKLRVVQQVKGKNAAQIMFVVGTNASGLNHPNWKENLKLALKLQEKLNAISPGLAKPIYISKNRYNQHVTTGALIVEIGGDGNTIAEGLESTKYLSQAVKAVVDDMK